MTDEEKVIKALDNLLNERINEELANFEKSYQNLKKELGAIKKKMLSDIKDFAKALPFDLLKAYTLGGRTWLTMPILIDEYTPLEFRWNKNYELLHEGGADFKLPEGYWKIMLIAFPVTKKEYEEYENRK